MTIESGTAHDGGSIMPPNQSGGDTTNKQEEGTANTTAEGGENQTVDPLTIDIKQAIEKARSDERDKLHARLERSDTLAKASSDQLAEAQAQIKKLTDTVSQLSAGKVEGEEGDKSKKSDEKALSQEAIQEAIDASNRALFERAEKEIFGPRLAQQEALISKLTKDLEGKEVESYRNDLIAANKDQIIPELVKGNTREELDQSLITAKQVFARTASFLTTQQQDAALQAAGKLPPLPTLHNQANDDKAVDVMHMSDAEYAAQRDKILADARNQVITGG